eukprot:TRINITY_DN1675_c0_g1_i8.p1 TRINITY_DN1675_c0_g1~~TRINITY_DN1675_c0_g1_i8.p1  ORF type:complete len:502 (-),score=60.94 TRINITY_DN1675_c0_g1_i8:142-1647(-)
MDPLSGKRLMEAPALKVIGGSEKLLVPTARKVIVVHKGLKKEDNYPLAYDAKTNVAAFKKQIHDAGGPSASSHDLVFNGQILSDEKLLKEYDIPEYGSIETRKKLDKDKGTSSLSSADREDLERKVDWLIISDRQCVTLNVGGKFFISSLRTLSSQPDSVLGILFSKPEALPRDSQDRISVTLDCDGDVFGNILSWLRRGELPKDLTEREEQLLRTEAKFLGLTKLERALDDLAPGGKTVVTFRDIIAMNSALGELDTLSLPGVDLHGQWLAGANLRGADLRGANLRRADLRAASCQKTNFQEADLTHAVFAGANLQQANFGSATLLNTNFTGSCLRGACLRGAKIRGADFSRAKLVEAQLHNDLKGLKFAECDFSKVDLSQVNLSYANLTGADLRKANLERANLSHAILIGTLLPAELKEVNFTGVNLTGFNFDNFRLVDCNFSDANLTDANLSTATLINVNFSGTILSNASIPRSLKPGRQSRTGSGETTGAKFSSLFG